MRYFVLATLPMLCGAFAPQAFTPQASTRRAMTPLKSSLVPEVDAVNDFNSNISTKLANVIKKADSLVLTRAMRFVNHAPAIVTLNCLLSTLGSTKFGFDIAPSALSIAAPAGITVPAWAGYTIPVLVVSQVAAVIRSSLADSDELSQGDISAMAVSNYFLSKALTATCPLNWVVAAVASGYSARNGKGDESPSIMNLSTQITASVTSAAAVLGVASKIPSVIPFLAGQEEVTAVIGLLAYLGLVNGEGAGKVKKTVNAVVIGGALISKIVGGALNMSNLVSAGTVVTVATAYVAAIAIDKARQALA
uniref:Uncharacterized protein n=2 Tax=Corethron hystrix TaxID=216773 RepID=A0A7S1BR44_9STRA|mmetsp:Transcript_35270/g.81676  ORF Transcript_35270/g.81676 Transcript_35270/m.81676 type:complete len:307 (+) Transcript_35270:248-1168(+)